ncbi:SIR2 family protein [Dyella tabacisoli]|uniref:Uncharacterized protein n=1 Tax=Dyella tabacisoli TaxID=2282381 RepID=A0A369UJG8_9GAMM|nr:SIR2 family protein [Dyella tabacisoli]RDD79730.1 hypothetical protein DVJ77_20865 [Dyella tabacisoli]
MSNSGPHFHDMEVLLERIVHASREIVFFFGSALSFPEAPDAPGVPSVSGVLDLVEKALRDSPQAFTPVHQAQEPSDAYQIAFAQLQAFRGQDAANDVIRQAVIRARKPPASHSTKVEAPNWKDPELGKALDADLAGWYLRPSLKALGQLLANHPGRLGRTVLTTNFDPLIQVAVQTAGGGYSRTMLHADGTLGQTEGSGVQIVHLHGFWHGTDTLHVPAQIAQPRPNLKRSLERLLQNRTLVIMGSGGWDDIFMSSLSDLITDNELNPDILWAFHESGELEISHKYSRVLAKLGPAVARARAQFFAGIDLHEFFPHLLDRLKTSSDTDAQRHINELLEKFQELAPDLRHKIVAQIDPSLVERVETLQAKHDLLERELHDSRHGSRDRVSNLETQTERLAADLKQAQSALTSTRLALTSAAVKDLSWLTMIRTRLMPQQPGRVPFHNSKEVALRGYHAAAGAQRTVPILREVTWSLVSYVENGLHRGYKAAIIFKGDNFVPGVVVTHRRRGESGPPTANGDYFWHLPNIYFGDYLEVSAGDNEPEAPLSWRDYEFQVKNPEGHMSEWILFTYPFDDVFLENVRLDSFQAGADLLEAGKPGEAVEPLRKAYVFSDRMFGIAAPETLDKKAMWERALDEAALAKLRFRVGDRLKVVSGPNEGLSGAVERLLLRHVHAYLIKPIDDGDAFQASDEQVERDAAVISGLSA